MSTFERITPFLEAAFTPSPTVFIVGFIVVFFVPVILHFILHPGPSYSTLPSILLVGPSNSGKTALLTLFERGPTSSNSTRPTPAPAPTHTSQAPASVELAAAAEGPTSYQDDLDATSSVAKRFLLIDTPGHAKLRGHALSYLSPVSSKASKTKSKLRGVVFVVDAAALADEDNLPATAEYLYDVLLALQKRMGSGRGSKAPASIPMLIAANKLDLFTALPAALVKSNLEAELGRIRRTRGKGLLDSGVGSDDIGAGEEADDWLGEYGSEKFSFKQMLEFDTEVEVIGGNVVGDGPGADKWWRWMADRI